MTKKDIINQIAEELMVEDEMLDYYEAMAMAERIYNNMYGVEGEDGI